MKQSAQSLFSIIFTPESSRLLLASVCSFLLGVAASFPNFKIKKSVSVADRKTRKECCDDSRFKEEHEILKLIGEGYNRRVYLVRVKKTGRRCAIKKIETGFRTSADQALLEARIYRELKHPNIVLYDTSWIVDQNIGIDEKMLFIRMEFCPNGTLEHAIDKGLAPERCWRMVGGLLQGLSYMHSQGIVHGDLKPKNILLDKEDGVKITDFGHAVRVESEFVEEQGSIVFRGDDATRVKRDVQYYGKVLLQMCYGPYNTDEDTGTALAHFEEDESTLEFSLQIDSPQDQLIQSLLDDALSKLRRSGKNTSDSEDSLLANGGSTNSEDLLENQKKSSVDDPQEDLPLGAEASAESVGDQFSKIDAVTYLEEIRKTVRRNVDCKVAYLEIIKLALRVR